MALENVQTCAMSPAIGNFRPYTNRLEDIRDLMLRHTAANVIRFCIIFCYN